MRHLPRFVLSAVALAAFAGTLGAAEKKLMHCFLYTPVKEATPEQWQAFYKATDALPGKVPGLTRVWYGKLTRPFNQIQFGPGAEEARKQLAAGAETATAPVRQAVRTMGVCMEFDGPDALKVYATHPAHKEWEEVYFKVRQYGTFTFDLVTE